jgi:VWFA-related protein
VSPRTRTPRTAIWLGIFVLGLMMSQSSAQPQEQQKPQDVPDAPSATRPTQPFPSTPPANKPEEPPPNQPAPQQGSPAMTPPEAPIPGEEQPAEQPAPVTQVPPSSTGQPRTPAQEELFKITTNVNQVLVPVMVKNEEGRLVSGLLPKDFTVLESGIKQNLNYFTSDSFPLSAAVVLDLGMPDVAIQKVNKTFPALQGAFGQFDEVAVYTYSSTYSRAKDYSSVGQTLAAVLNQLKTVRGRNNGPPVTGGPLGPQGPTINNIPVDAGAPTVSTPPREAHVLNDAILAAAIDLSKRDRSRRKIIFVISDGREYGSNASYSDVLRVLLSNGILVYGIGVEGAAIPIYGKLQQKIRLPKFGYGDILPKYANATGGEISNELAQADIDRAYARVIGDARNQYTMGYLSRSTPSSAYRQIEVRVNRPSCKSDLRPCVDVTAKDGYYPLPPVR